MKPAVAACSCATLTASHTFFGLLKVRNIAAQPCHNTRSKATMPDAMCAELLHTAVAAAELLHTASNYPHSSAAATFSG